MRGIIRLTTALLIFLSGFNISLVPAHAEFRTPSPGEVIEVQKYTPQLEQVADRQSKPMFTLRRLALFILFLGGAGLMSGGFVASSPKVMATGIIGIAFGVFVASPLAGIVLCSIGIIAKTITARIHTKLEDAKPAVEATTPGLPPGVAALRRRKASAHQSKVGLPRVGT